jgi:hypothetical protein
MKFCVLAAACVATSMAAMSEPPAFEVNDGSVDMFSPSTGTFQRDRMVDLDKGDMEDLAATNAAAAAAAKASVEKMKAAADGQKTSIDDAAAGVANGSDKMAEDQAAAEKLVETKFAAGGDVQNAIAQNDFDTLVAAEKAELQAFLQDEFKKMTVPSSLLSAGTSSQINTAKTAQAALKKEHVALAAELAAHEACAVTGFMYDVASKKCKALTAPAEKFINKVYHRMFSNSDGRDSGYVSNRYVQFKKTQDDTYMRMFYYDNLRVHGHTSHAVWNVMVCDANGNGCAHCNDPGRLNLNKWSGHQHNWWMQDYMAHTIMGLCKRSDNRALKKGTYQFRVMISNNRYDIYTGHNQHSSFTVDEVVKF